MFCCKGMKKGDCLTMSLKILGAISLGFFIITIWPAALTWVISVNAWIFLVAAIVLMAIPHLKYSKKKKK